MAILLFEDSTVSQLAPITTARAACCITAGSYHLIDLLRLSNQPLVLVVRKFLRSLMELDYADVKFVDDASFAQESTYQSSGPQLLLNARLTPSIDTLKIVQEILRSSTDASGIVWDGDHVAAIIHPGWSWEWIAAQTTTSVETLLLAAHSLPRIDCRLKLMSYPHEVIQANMSCIAQNLEHRIASGRYEQKADGLFVAEGAKLGEFVLTETDNGPIVIDEYASVGPYTLLRGPIYIGPKARILEHAAIKDAVSLGHTTKIGGEVEAAVVEPYSNKQHHGFLGHSYLGSWINLGAGTCNSDLKNTYGTVNMEYPHGKAATGMQFLGCVMGDYSKTAINTGIFTGKVIGVCSMMYGFVTGNVPSYVNYARLFGQMTTLPPEVMIATQQRMFSRRKVEQRPCDMQLLHDMYRMTQGERDKFGEALGF
jgi:UDP-N-acetylglucosamine diphosphorylase / glucose-1-phosphate thymidylyltransferase / UDP-N-acetylgalactosamine diphosphorylase / glucosamine-1-phosphate N-acetyltransferase / galactosamine-1-phosphate N-acetyltransferase